MTEKQNKFCESYLKTKDKVTAAIEAGYRSKDPYATGCRLLRIKAVQNYLQEKGVFEPQSTYYKESVAGNNEILEYLTKVLRSSDQSVGVRDKMRAAELLGKNVSLFNDSGKEEVTPIIFYGEKEI